RGPLFHKLNVAGSYEEGCHYARALRHERGSKPVTNAHKTFHGGQLIKWGSFDPLKLAQFMEHMKKPIYLKHWEYQFKMDVFIPEEYVIRRRFEKKEAAVAEERSNMVVKASQRNEVETKSLALLLYGRAGTNGFVASGGINENIVFSCLSA
ncbi:hypothetical protein Goari_020169, partial [Gossypium aridum]|nr:hypothetical protein [Gossypium aridum]